MGGRVGQDVLNGLGFFAANLASGAAQGFARKELQRQDLSTKIQTATAQEQANRGLLHLAGDDFLKGLTRTIGKPGTQALVQLSQANEAKGRFQQLELNRRIRASGTVSSLIQGGPAPSAIAEARGLGGTIDQALRSNVPVIQALPQPTGGFTPLVQEQPSPAGIIRRREEVLTTPGGAATAALAGQTEAVSAALTAAGREETIESRRLRRAELDQRIAEFNARQNEVDIRDAGTVTDEAGFEMKQFLIFDKQTGQQLFAVNGDPSAPELTNFSKQIRELKVARESGDSESADFLTGKILADINERGFSVTILPDGTVQLNQGGGGAEGDKVLKRSFTQQKLAMTMLEGTIEQIDALNLTEADFGLGGFVQAVTQNTIAQTRSFVLKVAGTASQQKNLVTVRDNRGKPVRDVTAKWFNAALPAKDLLFNTLAIMRAGVFGQEGRGLSDKDMERQVELIKASNFQQWLAIRQTILNEIDDRRVRLDATAQRLKINIGQAQQAAPTAQQQAPASPRGGIKGIR